MAIHGQNRAAFMDREQMIEAIGISGIECGHLMALARSIRRLSDDPTVQGLADQVLYWSESIGNDLSCVRETLERGPVSPVIGG